LAVLEIEKGKERGKIQKEQALKPRENRVSIQSQFPIGVLRRRVPTDDARDEGE
jgi:hypothetical protein